MLHSVYHWPNRWDHVPAGASTPRGESSQWGDYHAREVALYVKRLAEEGPYLAFFGPQPGPGAKTVTARRTALVTGGTRGIGLGIARALARDGWNLVARAARAPKRTSPPRSTSFARPGATVGYESADLASQDDRARLVAALARAATARSTRW